MVNSVIELSNGLLASCPHGESIRIWNPNTGECLQTIEGHTSWTNSVTQLKHGNLASSLLDKTIKIWNIYPDDLSVQQIYLVLRLSKYADHNEKIKLDSFWTETYNSLPGYLKDRYQNAVSKIELNTD